jgi:hypothetical protein
LAGIGIDHNVMAGLVVWPGDMTDTLFDRSSADRFIPDAITSKAAVCRRGVLPAGRFQTE